MADNSQRDELRAAAPDLAAFVDECRRVFGEVKVTYLRLPDGREFGKRSQNKLVHPTDARPVHLVMEEWNRIVGQRARSRGSRGEGRLSLAVRNTGSVRVSSPLTRLRRLTAVSGLFHYTGE